MKLKNDWKSWIKATAIRTVRTMAQAAIAAIGAAVMIDEVNWIVVLSTAGLSGVVCILMALAGLPEAPKIEVSDTAA